MTRKAAFWLTLAALATAAQAQPSAEPQRVRRGYANPSAVIATEIAFARLAQAKGQWTAYRETAARDAVVFEPDMRLAQAWLRKRPDPPAALRWQPRAAWSSCDGTLTITSGAWQDPAGRHGSFVTVWQREEKGGYKWVLTLRDASAEAGEPPEMIAARVADCSIGPSAAALGKQRQGDPPAPPPFDPAFREGRSRDGTLCWRVTADDSAGGHTFVAEMAQEGAMRVIREWHVRPAPAG